MKDLCTIAKSHGLQGWEVPAGLLLEPVPFSLENGLLTAVQKKNRPKLELKYRIRLEELYRKINANQSKRYSECTYACACYISINELLTTHSDVFSMKH